MNELFGIRASSFEPSDESLRKDQGIQGTFNGIFTLTSEPFDFEKHGKTLHKWCNKPYSAKFWNMQGSYDDFTTYYKEKQSTEGILLTMFFIDGEPLAFAESYPIIGSELESHISGATNKDCGIHFLMAPPRKIAERIREFKRSISFFTLLEAVRNLFKSGKIDNIYAEPDRENYKACHLASTVGFDYIKDIELTDKAASLFQYKKSDFKCH